MTSRSRIVGACCQEIRRKLSAGFLRRCTCIGFRVQSSGYKVQGLELRVHIRFRVKVYIYIYICIHTHINLTILATMTMTITVISTNEVEGASRVLPPFPEGHRSDEDPGYLEVQGA